MTSKQWLGRAGLVMALAASQVVLLAVCGARPLQVLVLMATTAVFVISYHLTASPGKLEYEDASFRPVLAMHLGALVATTATGGPASPLLPLVAVAVAFAWTMEPPRWRDAGLGLASVLVLLVPLHPSLPRQPFSGTEIALLAGWSTFLAAWAIFRRVAELLSVQRRQATALARMRESALADAASRREGIGSMTTKLAHELKNPLAAVKSLIQLSARQATDEKLQRRLEIALTEVERMGAILLEYLDLARPVVDARVAAVELDELMSDVGALVAGRADVAGIQLSVEGHGGLLQADARLLKEALVNLLCNAIEATPRGGSVAVTYDVGTAGASIVVRDTGTGMSKDVANRIGTPYFTTRKGGSGLGVVLARTAIAQHGGTLEYQSSPGAGTVATIALPLRHGARARGCA